MGRNWHELPDIRNLVFGIQILGLGCRGWKATEVKGFCRASSPGSYTVLPRTPSMVLKVEYIHSCYERRLCTRLATMDPCRASLPQSGAIHSFRNLYICISSPVRVNVVAAVLSLAVWQQEWCRLAPQHSFLGGLPPFSGTLVLTCSGPPVCT